MKLFTFFDKITLFNKLLEQESTGTPDEFATQLGISRSSLYEIIDELRSKDVAIAYSRTRCTFYYKKAVILNIRFEIQHLETMLTEEIQNISGGSEIFSSVLFGGRSKAIFAP